MQKSLKNRAFLIGAEERPLDPSRPSPKG